MSGERLVAAAMVERGCGEEIGMNEGILKRAITVRLDVSADYWKLVYSSSLLAVGRGQ